MRARVGMKFEKGTVIFANPLRSDFVICGRQDPQKQTGEGNYGSADLALLYVSM